MSVGRDNSYHKEIINRFTKAMVRKLRAYEQFDKKGRPGWRDENVWALYEALELAVHELRDLIKTDRTKPIMSDMEEECADIANLVMMIADWHREKKRAYL